MVERTSARASSRNAVAVLGALVLLVIPGALAAWDSGTVTSGLVTVGFNNRGALSDTQHGNTRTCTEPTSGTPHEWIRISVRYNGDMCDMFPYYSFQQHEPTGTDWGLVWTNASSGVVRHAEAMDFWEHGTPQPTQFDDLSFALTDTEGVATVGLDQVKTTLTLAPSTHPSMYRVQYMVTNSGAVDALDVHLQYAQAVTMGQRDWPFATYAQLAGVDPVASALEWSGNGYRQQIQPFEWGCVSGDPFDPVPDYTADVTKASGNCIGGSSAATLATRGPGTISGGSWFSTGPIHQGASFRIDLGDFEPGESRGFTMFVGVTDGGRQVARSAVDAVDAELWWYFNRGDDPAGSRLTFTLAVSGLGSPSALFDWDPVSPCAERPVTFTNLSIPGARREEGSMRWDFGDGSPINEVPWDDSVTHTYTSPGTYDVALRVKDENGWPDESVQQVTVRDCTPRALLACVGLMDPEMRVVFTDFSTSVDAALEREWDLGDGTTGDWSGTFEHDYAAAGSYTVRLRVWDGFQESIATETCTALINHPPVIYPIQDITVYVGTRVEVVPSASDPDGDGVKIAYIPGVLPPTATFSGGVLTWTPEITHLGRHGPVMFTASDGRLSVATTFFITVLDHGDPAQPKTSDSDGDGQPDSADACPSSGVCTLRVEAVLQGETVEEQVDLDGPSDADHDGVPDAMDNCRLTPNPLQADFDGDRIGDACDDDVDGDRTVEWQGLTRIDNCPWLHNPEQEDADRDGVGDSCDRDRDSDGVPDFDALGNPLDNCVWTPNPDQVDDDQDGKGDACAARNDGPAAPRQGHLGGLVNGIGGHQPSFLWLIAIALGAGGLLALEWCRHVYAKHFTRLKEDRLLDHPLRKRIHEEVNNEPGIHYAELMRRCGVPGGQLQHHMRMMVQGGIIAEARVKGYLCYSPKTPAHQRMLAAHHALRATVARRVLGAVAGQDRPARELAERLDLRYNLVWYHLKRLEGAGLVELHRGRELTARLTEMGRAMLEGWAPGPPPAAKGPTAMPEHS